MTCIAISDISTTACSLAALGAAGLWGFSALSWSLAGRRVGSVAVTAIRVVLASAILLAVYWMATGRPLPSQMPAQPLGLLLASGALHVGIGDMCLFRGLLLIGPRLGMLIASLLTPVLTAIVALAVGERLSAWAVGGLVLTVVGVAYVVSDPHGGKAWPAHREHYKQGVLFSMAAPVAAAFANVLARMAFRADLRSLFFSELQANADTLSAAFVRVLGGAAIILLCLPLLGCTRTTLTALTNRRAMLIVLVGTIVGPVIGMWLSMVAFEGIKTGVAAALMTTTPIFMIPIAYFAYGERPTMRSLVGTIAAMVGVLVLFLRP